MLAPTRNEPLPRSVFLSLLGGASALILVSFFLSIQWIQRPFLGFLAYDNLAVSPFRLDWWGGSRAGLGFLEQVLSVNERKVATGSDMDSMVDAVSDGSVLVESLNGDVRRVSAFPVTRFTLRDWALTYGIYLIISVVFLGIGVWPVLAKARGSPVALFLFMCVSIFVWFVTAFDFSTTRFFPRFIYVLASVLTPTLGVHLSLLLFGNQSSKRLIRLPLRIRLLYLASLAFGVLYLLTFYGNPAVWRIVVKGIYAYLFACAILFQGVTLRACLTTEIGLEKKRALVVLCGSFLGLLLPSMGTVAVSVLGWAIPFNVVILASVCFPFSIAYGLVKYNLFQIEGLIRRSVESFLFALILATLYVLIFFGIGSLVPAEAATATTVLFFLVLSGLVTKPALGLVQRAVTSSLYSRGKDYRNVLKEAERELRSTLGESELIKKILCFLCDRGGIGKACLALKSEGQEFEVRGVAGINLPPEGLKFSAEEPLPRLVSLTRSIVAREELNGSRMLNDRIEEMMALMDRLSAHLAVPLIWGENVQGLIAAGGHVSGRPLRVEDYEFVEGMARLASVCLENISLFHDLQLSEQRYKNLLAEAEGVRRNLDDANRAREEWIANISHEVRTPLNGILGFTHLLKGKKGDLLDDEAQGFLDRIRLNAENLHRLLTDLLDFSKARSGRAMIRKERVHVGRLVESLQPFVARLVAGRPVVIRVNISSDPWIETDRTMLKSILLALLDNAAKFTEAGTIGIETHSHASGMEIRVYDTGIGIKDEDKRMIFEEFKQLDGSSTRERGGTGLGLALCRKYADMMGATLSVESTWNSGSTFTLVLPKTKTLSDGMRPAQ